ncbi:hypothetical protein ACFVW2_39710, partial [Streptomyces sp. NPDC058171]
MTVELQQCARGRLRNSYPVGARDVEIRVFGAVDAEHLTDTLNAIVPAIRAADPRCRKVVYSVDSNGAQRTPGSGLSTIAAAESAG